MGMSTRLEENRAVYQQVEQAGSEADVIRRISAFIAEHDYDQDNPPLAVIFDLCVEYDDNAADSARQAQLAKAIFALLDVII